MWSADNELPQPVSNSSNTFQVHLLLVLAQAYWAKYIHKQVTCLSNPSKPLICPSRQVPGAGLGDSLTGVQTPHPIHPSTVPSDLCSHGLMERLSHPWRCVPSRLNMCPALGYPQKQKC